MKLSERFKEIRDFTIKLCEPLAIEDYSAQPVIDVSPPKWHLAHTTWFFETFILKENVKGYKEFHPEFNYLFNSYYNTAGDRVQRPSRGVMTRPGVEEIKAFRAHVDAAMVDFLNASNLNPEQRHFVEVGLQHEQQHQELLITDLKYILNQFPILPVYTKDFEYSDLKQSPAAFYRIKEGIHEIGFESQGEDYEFAFDNESPRHKVYLNAFQISERLVTNGEYFEFMKAGGYEQFQYWLSEGWDWVNSNAINAPHYWYDMKGVWKQFTLAGLKDMNWNAPVTHISFFEADAYARWKGCRLPKEEEWEVAARQYGDVDNGNFVDEGNFHPKAGNGNQFYGDCWEWCNSAYLSYPGYKQEEGALGEYNGKFMINQMVLRGGSCATSRSHIRETYRNFFHPNLRWQFTGIRLAKDDN